MPESQREVETGRDLPSQVYSVTVGGCSEPKSSSQNSIWVSHVRPFSAAFPRHINRNLDQKWATRIHTSTCKWEASVSSSSLTVPWHGPNLVNFGYIMCTQILITFKHPHKTCMKEVLFFAMTCFWSTLKYCLGRQLCLPLHHCLL